MPALYTHLWCNTGIARSINSGADHQAACQVQKERGGHLSSGRALASWPRWDRLHLLWLLLPRVDITATPVDGYHLL
jgi:hypothetical protein